MSCQKCGLVSSNSICKACVLLQKLEEEKQKKLNNKVKIEYADK